MIGTILIWFAIALLGVGFLIVLHVLMIQQDEIDLLKYNQRRPP